MKLIALCDRVDRSWLAINAIHAHLAVIAGDSSYRATASGRNARLPPEKRRGAPWSPGSFVPSSHPSPWRRTAPTPAIAQPHNDASARHIPSSRLFSPEIGFQRFPVRADRRGRKSCRANFAFGSVATGHRSLETSGPTQSHAKRDGDREIECHH